MQSMDLTDKKILTLMNDALPLEERPFKAIADKLGLDEEDVISRTREMKGSGVIRRIGAVISPRHLGWHSTLCAVQIPEDRLQEYTSLVNSYDEVTHNYLRAGEPNCWFTLITPSRQRASEIINEIRERLKTEILDLPTSKTFKIKVSFDLENPGESS